MVAAYIPVSSTAFAVVDLEDVPAVLEVRTWGLDKDGYAQGYHPKLKRKVSMHKLVCDAKLVDHANRDRLDNRRTNLRASDHQRNQLNRPARLKNQCGYKGVYFSKKNQNWVAQLELFSRKIHVGVYVTVEDAARAYDRAMFEWAGNYGTYNFPNEVNNGA